GSWLRSDLVVTGTITAAAIVAIIKLAMVGIVLYFSVRLVQQVMPTVAGIKAVGWTSLQIAAALIAVYIVYEYA
ncbi:hypothetical protein LCGC14_1655580, partial [marine sediment metagenome]